MRAEWLIISMLESFSISFYLLCRTGKAGRYIWSLNIPNIIFRHLKFLLRFLNEPLKARYHILHHILQWLTFQAWLILQRQFFSACIGLHLGSFLDWNKDKSAFESQRFKINFELPSVNGFRPGWILKVVFFSGSSSLPFILLCVQLIISSSCLQVILKALLLVWYPIQSNVYLEFWMLKLRSFRTSNSSAQLQYDPGSFTPVFLCKMFFSCVYQLYLAC